MLVGAAPCFVGAALLLGLAARMAVRFAAPRSVRSKSTGQTVEAQHTRQCKTFQAAAQAMGSEQLPVVQVQGMASETGQDPNVRVVLKDGELVNVVVQETGNAKSTLQKEIG